MKEAGDPAAPERWTSLRMWMHIEQKGFQLGSILGVATSIVATPLNRYYLKKTSPPVNIITGRGVVLGLGFASILGLVKLNGEPQDAVEDRVFRLFYNEGQNRADHFAQGGMAAGLAASVFLNAYPNAMTPLQVLGNMGIGAAAGIAAHTATAPKKVKADLKSLQDSIDKMS